MQILNIQIGGLGFATLQNWSTDQYQELANNNIDILYLDTHANQMKQLPNQVQSLSANTHGAGGEFEIGKQKFQNIKEQVRDIISQHDFIITSAGFAGGTGSSFTVEIAILCEELGKTCFCFGNTPKPLLESNWQNAKQNFDDTKDYLELATPYSIIDSQNIQEQLKAQNRAWTDYELFYGNQVFNFILALLTLLDTGVDLQDMSKTILTPGNKLINITQETEVRKIIQALCNDNYTFGEFRNCSGYNLLLPAHLEQAEIEEISYGLEENIVPNDKKIRAIGTNYCILIANLARNKKLARFDKNFGTASPISIQAKKTDNENFGTFGTVVGTNFGTFGTNFVVPKLPNQQFLARLWHDIGTLGTVVGTEDFTSENTSLQAKADWVNNNLQVIENVLKITLMDRPMTKGSIKRWVEKIKNI